MLTTTDAKGNLQRVVYDVAGLLSGSWLTMKGGAEQVIVQSLTYSAAGQKLREEHGNGVVTTYTYEPQTQRLTGIRTERPAGHDSGAKVLQDLRYEYDPVGNVLKITNVYVFRILLLITPRYTSRGYSKAGVHQNTTINDLTF